MAGVDHEENRLGEGGLCGGGGFRRGLPTESRLDIVKLRLETAVAIVYGYWQRMQTRRG